MNDRAGEAVMVHKVREDYPVAEEGAASGCRRVRDLPESLQPRELMERFGAAAVADDVLLAVILRGGVRDRNVLELARDLLTRYGGSLAALGDAPVGELMRNRGIGKVKAQVLKAALELSRRGTRAEPDRGLRLNEPSAVANLLRETLVVGDQEDFWVVPLDVRNRLKQRPVHVSRGLLDASLVHPREVFREAIRVAAAAVIVAHTHPSGDPSPSAEDLRITRELVRAGAVVDIRVLDHVVLGRGGAYVSLREAGLVAFDPP